MILNEKDDSISNLKRFTEDLETRIKDLDSITQEKDVQIETIKNDLLQKDSYIKELEENIKARDISIFNLDKRNAELERLVQERESTLIQIYNSNGWKGLLIYYKYRDILFPPKTIRRSLVSLPIKASMKVARTIRELDIERTKHLLKDSVVSPLKTRLSRNLFGRKKNVGLTRQKTEMKEGSHTEATTSNQQAKIEIHEGFKTKDDENVNANRKSILVVGVYLAHQENTIEEIVKQLNQVKNYHVIQKWISLFGDAPSQDVDAVTALKIHEQMPKFVVLNKILKAERLERYSYILIIDDDIHLSNNFIDTFLELQNKYDFALAQPARTHNSFIDHPFVEQFDGLTARRTRFIEIGPFVSIRNDVFGFLLPFDEDSPMGWGYDFVWPCLIEKAGLRMGIVDATPVDHSIRKPVKNYNYDEADKIMQEYLLKNPHLSKDEAFTIVESYVKEKNITM
jgi:hypothetical protein